MATKIYNVSGNDAFRGCAAADGAKLATVNRVARLIRSGEAGLARIHSISNHWVELSSSMDLRVGQRIGLDFSERVSMRARVSAREARRYRLDFDHAINCAALLRQLIDEARSKHARALRIATGSLKARGQSRDGLHDLEVEDISQRGMKVRHDGSFAAGLRLCVQLPNGLGCRGIVRWTRERYAGLLLIDVLSTDELGAITRLNAQRI